MNVQDIRAGGLLSKYSSRVLDEAVAWTRPRVDSRCLMAWSSSPCSIPGEGAKRWRGNSLPVLCRLNAPG